MRKSVRKLAPGSCTTRTQSLRSGRNLLSNLGMEKTMKHLDHELRKKIVNFAQKMMLEKQVTDTTQITNIQTSLFLHVILVTNLSIRT
jgi:hypothetical protein